MRAPAALQKKNNELFLPPIFFPVFRCRRGGERAHKTRKNEKKAASTVEIFVCFNSLCPGGIFFPFFCPFGVCGAQIFSSLHFFRDVTRAPTQLRTPKIIFLLSLVSLRPPRDDTTDDHLPANALVLVHFVFLVRDASSRRLCSSRIPHVQNEAQESGYDDDDESFSRFRSDRCQ